MPSVKFERLKNALYDKLFPSGSSVTNYSDDFMRCFTEVSKVISELEKEWLDNQEKMMEELENQGYFVDVDSYAAEHRDNLKKSNGGENNAA